MKKYAKVVAGCAAFMLAGMSGGCATTATSEGAAAAGLKSYTCAEGRTIRIEGTVGAPRLRLMLPDGQEAKLAAVEGAKEKTYSNGNVTLTFAGEGVNVTFFGGRAPLTGCVASR